MNGQWGAAARLILRDAVIVGLSVLMWQQWGSSASWPAAALLSLMTVLSAFLLHEWGHLLGALCVRASVRLPRSPIESPFLFRFDAHSNSREQFAVMSAGGFLISAVLVVFLLWALPLDQLAGQLSLGLVLIGVLATIVLEVPEFLRVWRGQPIPRSAAYFTPDED